MKKPIGNGKSTRRPQMPRASNASYPLPDIFVDGKRKWRGKNLLDVVRTKTKP